MPRGAESQAWGFDALGDVTKRMDSLLSSELCLKFLLRSTQTNGNDSVVYF